MAEIELDDQHYKEAVERGLTERTGRPAPASVRYERSSGRIVVEFDNGTAFLVPAGLLQGLEKAEADDIANVELLGETGLHWPSLDVDFTIAGLMQGIFGTARFMDVSRKGGQSRSAAKIAAARRNGMRGGRPRKSS
jgi:Protein of unknown function (DUF3532).